MGTVTLWSVYWRKFKHNLRRFKDLLGSVLLTHLWGGWTRQVPQCSWAWGCCHTTPNMHGLAGTCQVHPFEFRAAQHSWARAWGGSHPLLYRSYNLVLEQPGPAEVRVFWPLVDLTRLSCPQSDALVHTEWHCEKQPPKCVFVWSSLLWRVPYSAFSPQGPMR